MAEDSSWGSIQSWIALLSHSDPDAGLLPVFVRLADLGGVLRAECCHNYLGALRTT